MNWVFGISGRENLQQLLVSPHLSSRTQLLWSNVVKALVSELWFEGNQRVFHDTSKDWPNGWGSTRLLASSWSLQSKFFEDYSIQDICLNWEAFIFST